MNTLAHLTGLLAVFWGSIYAFQTLGEPAVGVVLSILCLVILWLTIRTLFSADRR